MEKAITREKKPYPVYKSSPHPKPITATVIEQTFQALNYPLLKDGSINTFGIRSLDLKSCYFNDTLGLYWVDKSGKAQIHLSTGTVDPGSYYLTNPMHPDGTAVMKFQFKQNAYKIGLHKGEYEALVQCSGLEFYRISKEQFMEDNIGKDADEYLINLKGKEVFFGNIGLNQHRASSYRVLAEVGLYSAGCQVRNNFDEYFRFLQICKSTGQQFFNYALFGEQNLVF